jgi:hypothetical protein
LWLGHGVIAVGQPANLEAADVESVTVGANAKLSVV